MTTEESNNILKRLIDVLCVNGIEGTTTRQLCKSAEVGTTVLYEKWGNKENMVIACGNYVTLLMESELRTELVEYANNNVAMGEYFFRIFKKYKKEVRFCMQLMTSPNPNYSDSRKNIKKIISDWSDELAGILDVEAKAFRGNFASFLSCLYFYCMTEDEDVCRMQRFYLYKEFNNIKKATRQ